MQYRHTKQDRLFETWLEVPLGFVHRLLSMKRLPQENARYLSVINEYTHLNYNFTWRCLLVDSLAQLFIEQESKKKLPAGCTPGDLSATKAIQYLYIDVAILHMSCF